MKYETMDPTRQKFAKQIVRIGRSSDTFFGYALKNLPIMMFLMLPVFALILRLIYITRKILYIQHLIHSLHLHSVAFFFYGLSFVYAVLINPDHIDIALRVAFIVVTIYSYISFLTVYKQGWFKSLIKFGLTGWFYSFALTLGLVLEISASFWLF